MLNLYVFLNELNLDSGYRHIIPIYKDKVNDTDWSNYGQITLKGCLGRSFTSILNERLT